VRATDRPAADVASVPTNVRAPRAAADALAIILNAGNTTPRA
jgi:hypothetical protein